MSDCSTNAFANTGARGSINGRIYWDNGRHTDFIYARIVNGEERKADYIMLDNERYERVRECELEHHETGWVSCRECNTSWKNDRPHVYRRCPYCGARVKEGGE